MIRASALFLALALPAGAAPPERVVSINLCTDQLAMLVAAPGQLVSVSWLARDPALSAMPDEARALPANHGLAEDILRLRPDLVLAGAWSDPTTLAMLERLGLRVETFGADADMAGIRADLLRMGDLLGRAERARDLAAAFDARLAAVPPPDGPPPRAALYATDGYSAGRGSLSDAILAAAGLANMAADLGRPDGGFVPLERLVLSRPDMLVTDRAGPDPARAEEVLRHPALTALRARTPATAHLDARWSCATPHVADAVANLAAARP